MFLYFHWFLLLVYAHERNFRGNRQPNLRRRARLTQRTVTARFIVKSDERARIFFPQRRFDLGSVATTTVICNRLELCVKTQRSTLTDDSCAVEMSITRAPKTDPLGSGFAALAFMIPSTAVGNRKREGVWVPGNNTTTVRTYRYFSELRSLPAISFLKSQTVSSDSCASSHVAVETFGEVRWVPAGK